MSRCIFNTSDGLIVGHSAILEIKCPYFVKDYSNIRDAISDKKVCYKINLKML